MKEIYLKDEKAVVCFLENLSRDLNTLEIATREVRELVDTTLDHGKGLAHRHEDQVYSDWQRIELLVASVVSAFDDLKDYRVFKRAIEQLPDRTPDFDRRGLTRCQIDPEVHYCFFEYCPQNRDMEPARSNRPCPYDQSPHYIGFPKKSS